MPSSACRRPPISTLFPYTTLFRSANALGSHSAYCSGAGTEPNARSIRAHASMSPCRSIHMRRTPAMRSIDPSSSPAQTRCARSRSADRKSTRLNSSHQIISYAVFCLPPPPHIHTLSLHDALPICQRLGLPQRVLLGCRHRAQCAIDSRPRFDVALPQHPHAAHPSDEIDRPVKQPRTDALRPLAQRRSEEHTSELQSPDHLVCRLLLAAAPPYPHSFPTRRSSDLPTPWAPTARTARVPAPSPMRDRFAPTLRCRPAAASTCGAPQR